MKYETRFYRRRVAIFDTETGQQISKWWKGIYEYGLLKGESQYYQAVIKVEEYD